MTASDHPRIVGMLRRVIRDCHQLYRDSGDLMVRRHTALLEGNPRSFPGLMEDLHRGLLIKVYVTVVRADKRWSAAEKKVAAALIEHLWGSPLSGNELRDAATELFRQADRLHWRSLVAPFVRYSPLADSKAKIETIVMRLGNLIAKCDGLTGPEESQALHAIQRQLDEALYPQRSQTQPATSSHETDATRSIHAAEQNAVAAEQEASREERLRAATAELEELIGLDSVKRQVRSYANFLKMQTQRREAGLATMPISLHMTFTGNPGTGKTTVARIVGQILGAMGTLEHGRVIETDRSGLVADYAGQTATKTNRLCDSARGGVLFIDEAYSLVDRSADDAYGREAIQTLLKRMEDDRESMAVILAGYGDEMEQMIRSNPGLSSRVNTRIEFEDYFPVDLARIFEFLCSKNQYKLPADARHRLLIGFDYLFQHRDRHFGNGRLVRNAFEDSVRCLADRIAEVAELTESLLTTLTADDIRLPGVSDDQLRRRLACPQRLRLTCSGCGKRITIRPASLGRRVRCPQCQAVQSASWAELKWVTGGSGEAGPKLSCPGG